MSDIDCPYCKASQEINHDDGYGYEDGVEFEQACVSCDKEFIFTTEIDYIYNAYCQKSDHDLYQHSEIHGRPLMFCHKCEFTKLEEAKG